MGARGPEAKADLSVVVTDIPEKPNPPKDLTEDQAEEWRAVVNRLPHDWFPRETHGILAQYCCHVVERREIDELIVECKGNADFSVNDYDQLLKMREREGRAASSLATRLRITQQATYDKSKKKGSPAKEPWKV
jgi:hypothetical protein